VPRSTSANRAIRARQRANLMEAARRLLGRGDAPLTMEALAHEAGVSQGLAYRYFPSKEALFRELVAEVVQRTPGLSERLDQLPGGPRERLRFLVAGVLDRNRQNPEFYRFLVRSAHDPQLPGPVRRALRDRFTDFRAGVRSLIVAAQGAREVADDDPEELTSALLGCLEGVRRASWRSVEGGSAARFPSPDVVMRLLGTPSPRNSSTAREPRARSRAARPSRSPAVRAGRSRATPSQRAPQPFPSARHGPSPGGSR
jgi:AcrR family transcriptional regulator